jgi:hypothetical protein
MSVFIKKGTRRYAGVRGATNTYANRYFVLVDLDNGSIVDIETSGSVVTWSNNVVDYGNGWYRVEITGDHTSGVIDITFGLSDSASPAYFGALPDYNGSGTDYGYCYGFQIRRRKLRNILHTYLWE